MGLPHLDAVSAEYQGKGIPGDPPALRGAGAEYQGANIPGDPPSLRGVGAEYQGGHVPGTPPSLRVVSVEYGRSAVSGIQNPAGVVTGYLSISQVVDLYLPAQLITSEVLAISAVNAAAAQFKTESQWHHMVVEYIHSISGRIKSILYRKVITGVWQGTIRFDATSPTGTWSKRAHIIQAKSGDQLILGPANFGASDGFTMLA